MNRVTLLFLQFLVAVVLIGIWHVGDDGADRRRQTAAAVLLLDAL